MRVRGPLRTVSLYRPVEEWVFFVPALPNPRRRAGDLTGRAGSYVAGPGQSPGRCASGPSACGLRRGRLDGGGARDTPGPPTASDRIPPGGDRRPVRKPLWHLQPEGSLLSFNEGSRSGIPRLHRTGGPIGLRSRFRPRGDALTSGQGGTRSLFVAGLVLDDELRRSGKGSAFGVFDLRAVKELLEATSPNSAKAQTIRWR